MFQPSRLSSFQRLALWTTATTYFLILVGGLVRASGAGLGCPDWPRCFGSWIPPASAAALPPQFDPALFNRTLMWTEYLNRLLGVTVGFLILATAISAWRHHRHEPRILWTTVAALLLTGFQGWLGGRVVAHELAAWIVTVHMIVALVIVQLLLYATVRTWRGAERAHVPILFPLVLIVATMGQIGMGTQVRGALDAAIDSGIARASALASIGQLDYLHRDAALVILVGAIALVLWLRARIPAEKTVMVWAYVVAGLATVQVALGVVMAYVSLLPAAQVWHLTVASLLLGAETVVLLLIKGD
ncbi:MAG: COX15/CtaA family protein [Vicinamibacterales bacterium]